MGMDGATILYRAITPPGAPPDSVSRVMPAASSQFSRSLFMKTFLLLLLAAGSLCPLSAAAGPAGRPPNIVFFLADDIGIDGIGCYGADRFKGKTPNIDALAATGVRFEQGYSMPTCNPSRCVLMTGRYPFRYGNKPSFKNESSVAKVLRQSGYATGMAGKWRQMADTPRDWGFDQYLTDPEASGYYWEKIYTRNDEPVTAPETIYYPDVCLEFARDFFKNHRDHPFFFYYPTHLIHNKIVRTPNSRPGVTDADALYADMVAYLDKHVGLVVDALDALGLREQTMILFAGDNGTMRKFGGSNMTIGGRHVLGDKATMLEGGSRVPLIANWQGGFAPGRVVKDLVDFSDVLPTFAELGGAPLPAGVTIDGHSFAPQLRGEQGTPRAWVYVQHNTTPEWYVREQGWKLRQDGQLFDMSDAPFAEKPVLAAAAGGEAQAARQRLQAVLDELKPVASPLVAPKGKASGDEPPKRKKKKKPAKS